ncbi:hypothetical protein [Geosporobacter ferrireducens]|nr:hypothetical protein [Geosporobacter ferrireducens]
MSEDKIIIVFKSGIELEQSVEVRKKYQGCGRPKKNKESEKIGACV